MLIKLPLKGIVKFIKENDPYTNDKGITTQSKELDVVTPDNERYPVTVTGVPMTSEVKVGDEVDLTICIMPKISKAGNPYLSIFLAKD